MIENTKQLLSSVGINSLPVAIALTIIIFLLLRELITWYWKLNSILNMLQRIELTLEAIESELKSPKDTMHEGKKSEVSQEDISFKKHLRG